MTAPISGEEDQVQRTAASDHLARACLDLFATSKKIISHDIYSYTRCHFYWEENMSPVLLRAKWIQDVKVSILIKQEIIFNDSASIKTSPGFFFCGGEGQSQMDTPPSKTVLLCVDVRRRSQETLPASSIDQISRLNSLISIITSSNLNRFWPVRL